MKLNIDHFVLAADTLEQGVAYLESQLGVTIPFGGVHPTMGTHNCLMQLSDDLFFEIIAINPESLTDDTLKVKQPRWFSLDSPYLQAQLKQQPQLLTWVTNTRDMQRTADTGIYRQCTIRDITRADLSWKFSLPDDGALLGDGLIPYVLQWSGDHPAIKMRDLGCSLAEINLFHPQKSWIENQLQEIGAAHLINIESLDSNQQGYFELLLQTPKGKVSLSSKLAN
jgi:hypothetical protein